MSDFFSLLDKISERGRDERPEDYKNEDGLLYCGNCHQPKETRIETENSVHIYSIPCYCKQKEQEQEEEKKKRLRADEMRKQFLPRKQMRNCRFENADEAKHVNAGVKYAENWEKIKNTGTGLVFWGNTGTGKSFTALCIANALIDRSIPVRFFSSVDLVSDLMDREKRDSILKTVSEVPLLIIDDIGAERDTEFSKEQLCRIIDMRIESGKPLICTTNYSIDEMKEAKDGASARMFDRLLSVCVPVRVVGESRRKAAAIKRLETLRQIISD